jgi:hypothetical protein
MNGKFILGIFLVALIALTGIVNAGNTGTTDLQAVVNVPTQTLTLTITGSQGPWTLDHVGTNQMNPVPRPQLSVTNVGYPGGYKVFAADKQLSGQIPGPAGHMCKWNAQGNAWSAPCLKDALQILVTGQPVHLTGADWPVLNSIADYGPTDIRFIQDIDNTDENGNYRIVVTYTVIAN